MSGCGNAPSGGLGGFTLTAVGATGTCPSDSTEADLASVNRPQPGEFGRISVCVVPQLRVSAGDFLVLFSASEAFQWSAALSGSPVGCFGEHARVSGPVDDLQIGDTLSISGRRVQVVGPNLSHRAGVGELPDFSASVPVERVSVDMTRRNRPGIVCVALEDVTVDAGDEVRVEAIASHGYSCHKWFAAAEPKLARKVLKASEKDGFELPEWMWADAGKFDAGRGL